MVLQAFIDDSYAPDGTFVLGGHIASAETWAKFSRDWEEMLPFGIRRGDGRFHFKMAEMAANPERMARVPGFFRIIEKHVLCSISCKINTADLRRARNRLYLSSRPIEWGIVENSYLVTFRGLLDTFHTHKAKFLEGIAPVEEKVDFIFDNQAEKKGILATWDEYVTNRPEVSKGTYGATPRFEDDLDFLPLQAADFWALWVRKWYEEGNPQKIGSCDFGTWKAIRSPYPRFDIFFTDDELFAVLARTVRDHIGPHEIIYDVNYKSSLDR
jgi:hypothetical protein